MVDKTPGATDLVLIQRAAAGDVKAFDLLMHRHNQRLFRAARGILHDDAEAEEAIQDAWWNAYQHFKEFRADAEPLTWLTRIAINQALMHQRRNKSRDAVIQPTDPDGARVADDGTAIPDENSMQASDTREPDHMVARGEVRALIEARINELPDRYRAVFMLRGVEGMDYAEIAKALGLSQTAVRVRYMRARRMLRKTLQQDLEMSAGDAFSFAGARCDRIVANVHARLRAEGHHAS